MKSEYLKTENIYVNKATENEKASRLEVMKSNKVKVASEIISLPPPKKRLWKGLAFVVLAGVAGVFELVDDTEPRLASEEVLCLPGDSESGFAPVFARN